MTYVKVAQTSDFDAEAKKKIILEGKEILITKIDGSYYAIDNSCSHMGGSLYDGKLEGFQVVCPRHGSIFDVRTGAVVQRGKLFLAKVKVTDLRGYPVKIEDTDLLIGLDAD